MILTDCGLYPLYSQLAIGCNLCGMFIPGLCSATCPMAGLFCGGSGYLCAIASGENPAPVEPEEDRMVEMEEMVKAPRSFEINEDEEEDDDTEGRSFSPKMDMMKEKRDVHGDEHEEHSGDDGHDH